MIKVPPKVAVFGGGIGGLFSALKMAEAGCKVTIFEASNRLGGHMMTLPNGWDAGAQVIHSREMRLRALAKELNVLLTPPDDDTKIEPAGKLDLTYRINGRTYSATDYSQAFAFLAPAFKRLQDDLRDSNGTFTDIAHVLNKMSVDEFLHQENLELLLSPDNFTQLFSEKHAWVIDAIKQIYAPELGATNELAALALIDNIDATPGIDGGFCSLGDSGKIRQFANGASSLIVAMEKKLTGLGVMIRKNTVVTNLGETANGMEVNFSQDHTAGVDNFDSVISALPPPSLVEVKGVELLLSKQQWNALQGTKTINLVKICCPTTRIDIDADVCLKIPQTNGVQAWQNGAGKGGDQGSLTFYCEGVSSDVDIAGEFIQNLKEEYATAINQSVDAIFVDISPTVMDWRENSQQSTIRGNGCFFIPTKENYIALGSLHQQNHAAFSLVGGAPVEYARINGNGVTWNTGCMDGILASAERETVRLIDKLQERGHNLLPEQGGTVTGPNLEPTLLQWNLHNPNQQLEAQQVAAAMKGASPMISPRQADATRRQTFNQSNARYIETDPTTQAMRFAVYGDPHLQPIVYEISVNQQGNISAAIQRQYGANHSLTPGDAFTFTTTVDFIAQAKKRANKVLKIFR